MADLQRKTANLFDVLDYTDIQTSTNGGASNVVKTSSTISFKSNGENDYSGIYVPFNYYSTHINDYNISTTYTLSADVYTDVPCTIIFGGSATIVSIPAGTSRLSYRFLGNITLAFYIRNTTANITLSKIMFAINDTTYEPYYPHSLRKLTTATDTFTTLPVDIYADGNNATVGLKGNTVQNGTPTPDNPIMPQGCGNYSNLFNEATTVYGKYIDSNGVEQTSSTGENNHSAYIPIKSGLQYTLSETKPNYKGIVSAIAWYTSLKVFIRRDSVVLPESAGRTSNTWTAPSNAAYAIINFYRYPYFDGENDMLNEGSTALPYETYGQYKIPISSAGQTNNIYLGEVQTTRKIRKLVLTGEEEYIADTSYSRFITTFPNAKIEGLRLTQVYCTHFTSTYDGRPVSEVPNNSIYSSDIATNKFFIKTTDYTTAADFKSYLAQQYAAGTPVTVWYVLAEPETAVVNEPLMRIGDYADTVSGITIPTITGKDTFDVETTLKPSEVYLSYTGWHDAEVKEWDGSQWNK